MSKFLIPIAAAMVLMASYPASAHRSGCHRWHSCPSDRGTYVCGDLGYSNYCPKKKAARTVKKFSGRIGVVDGDTIVVAGQRIRIFGIDAPERNQTCWARNKEYWCGRRATLELKTIVAGNPVVCARRDRDRYGRVVAICRTGTTDIGREMVRRGWAAAYRQYSKDYVADEEAAHAAGLGVWQGHFTMPWIWRNKEQRK